MVSVGLNDRLADLRYVQRIHEERPNGSSRGDYLSWNGVGTQQPPQDRELELTTELTTEYTQVDALLGSSGSQEDDEVHRYLQNFYSVVEEIQEYIVLISQKNNEICQVQKLITSKPVTAVAEHIRRHDQLVEEVKSCSKRAFAKLQKIHNEIKENKPLLKKSPAIMRIKRAQFASLSYQLKQAMLDFNNHEDSYREQCKGIIKRQVQAVQPERKVSDETVEEIVDSQFTLMPNNAVATRMQCLDEVEARKREILTLERNVMELHDMFYQMMMLVEEQGDLIDHIETEVSKTAIYTERGTAKLKQAVEYKESSRKLRLCLCLVLTLMLTFVIVAVMVAGAVTVVIVCVPLDMCGK